MRLAPRLRFAASTLAAFAAASVIVGCETQPVAPRVRPAPTAPIGPPTESTPVALAEVKCTADRVAKTVACGPVMPTENVSGDIIVGGQNIYVALVSSNVNYVAASSSFTFDVALRNLIPQPLGTSDGSTADPQGIKVFFHTGPTLLTGTGAITVNGDGVGSFTGSNQPYFQYVTMVPQYAATSQRTWSLTMPPTVTTFNFTVYVSAPVQFPGGYVQVQSGSTSIRADGIRQLTGTSRTAVGNVVPGQTVNWFSNNPNLATVDATGLVSGVREGTLAVLANDGTRDGLINLTITPINRLWTAGANTSDPEAGNNWSRGVVPTLNDTLDVPVVGPSVYPVLTQNKTAASLILDDNAAFTLGPFNLTLTRGLTVGTVSSFTSSSGVLFLSGANYTITSGSRIPRTTINGTYTMSTNVQVANRLRIDAGRIRVNAARLRIDSQ